VTKAVDALTTRALYELGERDLAENRAAGLENKAEALKDTDVRWHFIGHVQRNKARRILALAEVLHSLDSLVLAQTVARICAEEGWQRQVYLQVNLTGEEAKHGMHASECQAALETVAHSPHLELLGLMGMGPLHPTPDHSAATVFASLANRGLQLQSADPSRFVEGRCGLSMGMSADLEAAVSAGSTCLRIGTDLFRSAQEAAL